MYVVGQIHDPMVMIYDGIRLGDIFRHFQLDSEKFIVPHHD